jgi:polyisoprenoid-binding protein YceI
MSTDNSFLASQAAALHLFGQPAALNLFGSDGRVESPFRGDWRVAPASSVAFSHKSMWGLLTARGTFTGITGEGHITDDGYVTAMLAVDAESLTTKFDRLTTHLLSADFFDVANHPTIEFAAHCVGPDGPDRATVNGRLTILGKTQHLSFPVRTRLERPNEVAVTGSTKVNRNDYGMSFDKLHASRGLTTVAFSLHFTR